MQELPCPLGFLGKRPEGQPAHHPDSARDSVSPVRLWGGTVFSVEALWGGFTPGRAPRRWQGSRVPAGPLSLALWRLALRVTKYQPLPLSEHWLERPPSFGALGEATPSGSHSWPMRELVQESGILGRAVSPHLPCPCPGTMTPRVTGTCCMFLRCPGGCLQRLTAWGSRPSAQGGWSSAARPSALQGTALAEPPGARAVPEGPSLSRS